jgi:hypothetical protein
MGGMGGMGRMGGIAHVCSNDFSRYPGEEGDRLVHALPWDCSCYG